MCVNVTVLGMAHLYKITVCCIISSYIFNKYLSFYLTWGGGGTIKCMSVSLHYLINIILGVEIFLCVSIQAELSFSQRKMCSELSRLKGDEVEEEEPETSLSIPATLQVRLLL